MKVPDGYDSILTEPSRLQTRVSELMYGGRWIRNCIIQKIKIDLDSDVQMYANGVLLETFRGELDFTNLKRTHPMYPIIMAEQGLDARLVDNLTFREVGSKTLPDCDITVVLQDEVITRKELP